MLQAAGVREWGLRRRLRSFFVLLLVLAAMAVLGGGGRGSASAPVLSVPLVDRFAAEPLVGRRQPSPSVPRSPSAS
jgi:hypothetical protein